MHIVGTQNQDIIISPNLRTILNDLLKFPLIDAIEGRRSRRFCLGAEIPDGVLSHKSKHDPLTLTELEQLLVLSTMGGVTGMALCYNPS